MHIMHKMMFQSFHLAKILETLFFIVVEHIPTILNQKQRIPNL